MAQQNSLASEKWENKNINGFPVLVCENATYFSPWLG